jgi:hypothetical protein
MPARHNRDLPIPATTTTTTTTPTINYRQPPTSRHVFSQMYLNVILDYFFTTPAIVRRIVLRDPILNI